MLSSSTTVGFVQAVPGWLFLLFTAPFLVASMVHGAAGVLADIPI